MNHFACQNNKACPKYKMKSILVMYILPNTLFYKNMSLYVMNSFNIYITTGEKLYERLSSYSFIIVF